MDIHSKSANQVEPWNKDNLKPVIKTVSDGELEEAVCEQQPPWRVSVIVPALNEAENIDALIEATLAQAGADLDLDVLIADGGSTDGTAQRVSAWEKKRPVKLVSGGGRGLAGDVLVAAEEASADVVVVMDADFSHPPEMIPLLVKPIFEGTHDMVIASRYVPGGSTPQCPWRRRGLSRMGAVLAWPLTDVQDPMSGFFAVRRSKLLAADPQASGFKIGLEVMVAGADGLRVTEVPLAFHDRARGTSKRDLAQMFAFGRRLMVLAGGAVSMGTATRFAIVGALGLAVDFFAFMALLAIGTSLALSHVASFALATVFNYTLNPRWTFARARSTSSESDWRRYAMFLTVCLLALFLRGGILATAVNGWGWPPEAAIVLAIGAAAIVNYLGSAFFVFPSGGLRTSTVWWRVFAIAVLGYVLLLRLAFVGGVNLIPEEAYYWNYAQHLDFGYLDHPPMIAWIIWTGTMLAGDSEFAVRIGASVCWLIAAYFCFQLTRNLYGKIAAFVAVLLFGALPFFFVTGFLMTPDAPLTAAWAACLYFLERALIGQRRAAWLGVGVTLGIGMLAKYTILLLGLTTLAYVLFDPRMRRWLGTPWPYLAALGAVLVFFPVIAWNFQNEWASFWFQGPRRVQEASGFSLHVLLGSILVLLTPIGLVAATRALLFRYDGSTGRRLSDPPRAFTLIYTLGPLSAFVAFSLFNEVKLNWTGPLWLAVLPMIARNLTTAELGRVRRWIAAIAVMLFTYGGAFHYLALGLPGVSRGTNFSLGVLPIGWKEFGAEVAKLGTEVEHLHGTTPLRAGMDKYFLSSQIAFYDPDKGSVALTAGRRLFGMKSLMYDRWLSSTAARGRDILLVSRLPTGHIADKTLSRRFHTLGPIREREIHRAGVLVSRFYYRIGFGYVPYPPASPAR